MSHRLEAPVCTYLDFTCDIAGAGEEGVLTVWWDPDDEDGGIEAAALCGRGEEDRAEPVPLGLLWLLVSPEDLLSALVEVRESEEASEP